MGVAIFNPRQQHRVDAGVRFDPIDQWTCPRDAFLYRIDGAYPNGRAFHAGLLVRSMTVIEAAPVLRDYVGKQWLDVAKAFVGKGWRAQLLKENPRRME